MILEHDRVNFYDLSSLVYCFSGGDVLPQETARRWKEKCGKEIYEGYGATETCGGITMPPVTEKRPPGTIGKVLRTKQIRIIDKATLEDVPDGQAGELIVSSKYIVDAYWSKEEETKESFLKINGLKWYRTGDVVRKDENGFFYFVDRTADTIKHKGYRVSSSEIEAALQEHPAVLAACAVGVPDGKVGKLLRREMRWEERKRHEEKG